MLRIIFGCLLTAIWLTVEQNVRQFQIPLQPSGSLFSALLLWRTRLSDDGSYRLRGELAFPTLLARLNRWTCALHSEG